jgi:hypothetical protein
MNRPGNKEISKSERMHIEAQLDFVRHLVRHCAEERMPQGPCKYCLEIYRKAMNQAIDQGVYE